VDAGIYAGLMDGWNSVLKKGYDGLWMRKIEN